MDQRLREIFSEHEDDEGFEKEGESQFAYEERFTMTLSATESSLEERRGEPQSVVGSETGSELGEVKIVGRTTAEDVGSRTRPSTGKSPK